MFYGGLLGLAMLLFWMWAVVDVIVTPGRSHRHLPKVAWILIVVLFWVIGAAAWMIVGRPRDLAFGFAGRIGGRPSEAKDDAAHLSERERIELERRDYYRRMDEELDRRLEEKRQDDAPPDTAG